MKRLPRIAAAMLDRTQELSRMAHRYRFMNECFILARGLNYPIALEFGIKTQETSFVRSRAYSVANFTNHSHCHAAGFYSGVCAGNRRRYG